MTIVIERRVLTDQVLARLGELVGVSVYSGEIPDEVDGIPQPPVIQLLNGPDPSGRVAPYVVVYPSPGTPTDEIDVADTTIDLQWTVQLTCAAGYVADLDRLIDRVNDLMYRWSPTVPGLAFGRMKPPPGFDPGPHRRDDNVSPARLWSPLQYTVIATN